MAKITIPPVSGGFDLKTTVDARLQQVEDELNTKVLYKTNPVGEDNSLDNDIDMDGNDLLNAGIVAAEIILLDGVNQEEVLQGLVDDASESAAEAAASEAASAVSASAALSSELQADITKNAVDVVAAQVASDVSGITIEFLVDGAFYDLGFVSDPTTLFPTDLGGLI